MCDLFSFINLGKDYYYFDYQQRCLMHTDASKFKNLYSDSHTSIASFYDLPENLCTKYEYNLLTKSLWTNSERVDSASWNEANRYVQKLDLKKVLGPNYVGLKDWGSPFANSGEIPKVPTHWDRKLFGRCVHEIRKFSSSSDTEENLVKELGDDVLDALLTYYQDKSFILDGYAYYPFVLASVLNAFDLPIPRGFDPKPFVLLAKRGFAFRYEEGLAASLTTGYHASVVHTRNLFQEKK